MAGKRFPYKTAYIACGGDSCRAAVGDTGEKLCAFGCIGCGACKNACKFGAVSILNGIASVDSAVCRACGACTKVCPKQVIHLRELANPVQSVCSSKLTGKEAKAVCSVSCIGCGICAKKCPADAITMEGGLPVINQALCLSCGSCAASCPRGAIMDARGIFNNQMSSASG